jgi:hypothetical protein
MRFVRSAGPDWQKWTPADPTSPHWYSLERFAGLITAYLASERTGSPERTVREFIAEFRGLSGTKKQKAITDETGLSGTYLHDLCCGDELNRGRIERLRTAMCQHSRPVKPQALGVLGQSHLTDYLVKHWYVTRDSVRYKPVAGERNGVPFVLEAAFGIYRPAYEGCRLETLVGLNWTATLSSPIRDLGSLLGKQRVDWHDPVVLPCAPRVSNHGLHGPWQEPPSSRP